MSLQSAGRNAGLRGLLPNPRIDWLRVGRPILDNPISLSHQGFGCPRKLPQEKPQFTQEASAVVSW